jgi:hypothetical protein
LVHEITFLQEAELEFLDTTSYYDENRPGLGRRFKDEVGRSLLWVAARPDICWLRPGGYRRLNLRVYIPYITRETTLWVLAVAHTGRTPEYWINRKKDIA